MGKPFDFVVYGLAYVGWVVASIWLAVAIHPLLLVPALIGPFGYMIHRVHNREERIARHLEDAAAAASGGPAFLPISVLLDPTTSTEFTQNRIAGVRCYACPEYHAGAQAGRFTYRAWYYTVIIDRDGHVHEVDRSRSFGELERRAQALASRFSVSFESFI